jgi:hypothetical protein
MVGGVATNLNGYQRTTDDMDILIRDSLGNRKNIRLAFKDIALLIILCWKPYNSFPAAQILI